LARPPAKGSDKKGGKKQPKKEYEPPKVMRRGDDPFGAGNHHPFFSPREELKLEKPPMRNFFRLLFTPFGRAAQSDFWMWGSIYACVLFAMRWFANDLAYMPHTPSGWHAVWIVPTGPQLEWCLLPLWMFFCLLVNRYHDMGNYGTGVIFLFTPFLWPPILARLPTGWALIEYEMGRIFLWIGPAIVISVAALHSKMDGSNMFGDDPTET
jgi:uncharacterized membrane protein YhaH (DUF805 family)